MDRTALTIEAPRGASNPVKEDWTDKALREAHLLKEGAKGFVDAAQNADLTTAGKVVLSIGVGLGLAYLSRGRGFGRIAGRTIGTVSGLAFLSDVAVHGKEVGSAAIDTWKSPANMEHNSAVMRKHLGEFAFDTTIMSAAGLAGGSVGYKLFHPNRAAIPAELTTQIGKTGIRQDYANKLLPAGYYANIVRNAEGKFSPEKIARAQRELPGALKSVETYSQYWHREIAAFNSNAPQKVDAVALENYFVHGGRGGRRLNKIASELKRMALEEANEKTATRIMEKLGQAQSIIYGQ